MNRIFEKKNGYTGSRYAPLKICPFLSLFHFFTINKKRLDTKLINKNKTKEKINKRSKVEG